MNGWTVEVLGLIAGSLTTLAFVPQLLRTIRTRSTRDISLPTLLLFLAGLCMWLAYGVLVGSLSITIANLVTIVLNFGILAVKLREEKQVLLPAE